MLKALTSAYIWLIPSLRLALVGVAAFALPVHVSAATIHADICVYSGDVGGIMAALEASRQGHTVSIIEPSHHLGGMTSGGLSNSDQGNKHGIGGLAAEFYRRLAAV